MEAAEYIVGHRSLVSLSVCLSDVLRISCLSVSAESGSALLTLSLFTDAAFAFTEKFPFDKLWKIYL